MGYRTNKNDGPEIETIIFIYSLILRRLPSTCDISPCGCSG